MQYVYAVALSTRVSGIFFWGALNQVIEAKNKMWNDRLKRVQSDITSWTLYNQ